MKGKYTFTAQIEQDAQTGLFVGYIPAIPGAHSQGATLDELHVNLTEVLELCLEEIPESEIHGLSSKFVGTQQISVDA